MVLIYVKNTSPRLQYIAHFIFKEIIKTPYAITSHEESFRDFDGIKINYSSKKISEKELKVMDCGLLFQQGITEQAYLERFGPPLTLQKVGSEVITLLTAKAYQDGLAFGLSGNGLAKLD